MTVVQCSQCAMLPAHVRYQVKADKSTVAVSSQLSGEFPRQLSAVSAPVSSSSSRRVPASWQPRTGIRVAGVALSHARLRPRGSATCRQICTLDTDLCSNTVLALPSPTAHCSFLLRTIPPCPATLYRSRLVSKSPAARTSPLRS